MLGEKATNQGSNPFKMVECLREIEGCQRNVEILQNSKVKFLCFKRKAQDPEEKREELASYAFS